MKENFAQRNTKNLINNESSRPFFSHTITLSQIRNKLMCKFNFIVFQCTKFNGKSINLLIVRNFVTNYLVKISFYPVPEHPNHNINNTQNKKVYNQSVVVRFLYSTIFYIHVIYTPNDWIANIKLKPKKFLFMKITFPMLAFAIGRPCFTMFSLYFDRKMHSRTVWKNGKLQEERQLE